MTSLCMPPTSITHRPCRFTDLVFNRRELYMIMGYGEQTPDGYVQEMIESTLSGLAQHCIPEYGYVICPGEYTGRDQLQLSGTMISPGRIITSYLREATCFAVFTATVGAGFDQWCHHLRTNDDMVGLFVADSLGSVLAEACVGLMVKNLETEMAEAGLKISNNYSPGYCDWPLTDQARLFGLLPGDFCGITLTDSCLMLPVKSVSGIIGIGPDIRKRPYGCDICNMKTCIKNKKTKTI